MSKERYISNWYENRQFAVIEVPCAEDMDFIQELFVSKGIHYDYRALSETGNHVLIIFKDNMDKTNN